MLLAVVGGVVSSHRLSAYADEFTLWNDVLVRNPQNATAQYNAGTILLERDEPEQAAEYFRRAIALRDDYPQAHHNLGSVLATLGQHDEATREFERAVELEPRYAMGHVKLGITALDAGRTAEAKKEFQAALHWQPNDAAAHAGMAEVLAERRQSSTMRFTTAGPRWQAAPNNAKAHNIAGRGARPAGSSLPRRSSSLRPRCGSIRSWCRHRAI